MLLFAELLPGFTERYAEIPEVQEGMIRIAWNHCVGQTLRQVSEPLEFRGGVLVVRVTHAQWQSTLSSMRAEIIARINGYLKRPMLQEVRIKQ